MSAKVYLAVILIVVIISNLSPRLMPAKLSTFLIIGLSAIGLLGIFDQILA